MTTRRPAAGALLALLLSLAVWLVLAGLLTWWYYAGLFLANPDVIYSPSRLAWLLRYWHGLILFVPGIFLWWLAVFTAARRRQAIARLFARADLWLLLAAILWGLTIHAIAMNRVPVDYRDCGSGFIAMCSFPRPSFMAAVIGVIGAIFLLGLAQRLKGDRRVAAGGDEAPGAG